MQCFSTAAGVFKVFLEKFGISIAATSSHIYLAYIEIMQAMVNMAIRFLRRTLSNGVG
jgi:hypothetical protein